MAQRTMIVLGLSTLLAACGGSSVTCSDTPDLSLVPGCIWDAITCSCEGEDMGATSCSPMQCGANSEFNYVTCLCEMPDLAP